MNDQELQKRLELLRTEHRDLDAAITALSEAGSTDQLQIARLKKGTVLITSGMGAQGAPVPVPETRFLHRKSRNPR